MISASVRCLLSTPHASAHLPGTEPRAICRGTLAEANRLASGFSPAMPSQRKGSPLRRIRDRWRSEPNAVHAMRPEDLDFVAGAKRKPLDGRDGLEHAPPGRWIGGMHADARRPEAACGHRFFDPDQHVVAGAVSIVPEIMIQAELGHVTLLQQTNDFIRPARGNPARRRWPRIVQIHLDHLDLRWEIRAAGRNVP